MDLGTFTQPVLLFGGPYSNLDAVKALKKQADSIGIQPSHIICTGDIVAYCAQPYETVEMIRNWGIHVLMGNCEESFANKTDDCGCGFEKGTSCDLLSIEWFQYANSQLIDKQRQWFAKLPRKLTLTFFDKKIQIVHGSVSSINQFLFASSDPQLFMQQTSISEADIIIAGHSGIPFSKKINNKLWHNTGAIGMPANDGSPNTWFSILSKSDEKAKIESIKLDYNYERAYAEMHLAGLKNEYANAVKTGLWPSMDVLPEEEKLLQGKTIQPHTTYY